MYKDLSREEKKDLRERFRRTSKGDTVLQPLNRLVLEGLFLVGCAIFIVIVSIINNYKWYLYFTAAVIFIFGLFFILGQHYIRVKNYNNYLKYLNKNKNSKKKKLTKKK